MPKIEDYALIGDCETAALVSRKGSIDWLCWPTFASGACFARLVGTKENGYWKLAPSERAIRSARRYIEGTLILETTHEVKSGVVQVLDFMPPRGKHSDVVRLVRGLRGSVAMQSVLALRFSYGSAVPWVEHLEGEQGEIERHGDGVYTRAGPDSAVFRASVPLEGKGMRTVAEFTVAAGQSVSFVLTYGNYGDYTSTPPPAINPELALRQTEAYWKKWIGASTYRGPHRAAVERSLLTLKALTYRPTGGIVAAPTTSLPESIGGVRNWDYRYCWLRDTTFTLLALMNGGFYEEAGAWISWLRRTVAGSPEQVQIMYGIAGQRTLTEWEVDWLRGYEKSAPVRIGNAAHQQLQLDIYGETLDAVYHAHGRLPGHETIDYGLLVSFIEHLETIWKQPDDGIWETRGGRQHFVFSKVMAWVAFDRAVRIAEKTGIDVPLARWKKTRDAIHAQVCRKGWNRRRNSFVQHYGSRELDASLLLIPMVGFLPPEDPRVRGTVEAIEKHLMEDGLVRRYDPSKSSDGLPGSEGMFLACSFWMVSNLKFLGRDKDALRLFERLLTLTNDLGLLSEEYDVKARRQVGNFPQALSHIALLGAAYQLFGQDTHRRHTAGPAAHQRAGLERRPVPARVPAGRL